jgi:hypothetical protein
VKSGCGRDFFRAGTGLLFLIFMGRPRHGNKENFNEDAREDTLLY